MCLRKVPFKKIFFTQCTLLSSHIYDIKENLVVCSMCKGIQGSRILAPLCFPRESWICWWKKREREMNMWLKTNKIFYFNALSGEYAVEFYKRSGVYDTVHRVYMKAGFFLFLQSLFPLADHPTDPGAWNPFSWALILLTFLAGCLVYLSLGAFAYRCCLNKFSQAVFL